MKPIMHLTKNQSKTIACKTKPCIWAVAVRFPGTSRTPPGHFQDTSKCQSKASGKLKKMKTKQSKIQIKQFKKINQHVLKHIKMCRGTTTRTQLQTFEVHIA